MVVLQQKRSDVPARDLRIIEGELWVYDVAANHSGGFREVVLVMAVRTAEGDHGGDRVAAASGAPGTLLIVRASGRHVAQGDSRQHANIDTDLHRSRAREHV